MAQILKYSDLYKEDIKRLNYEWLEKYFEIEPIDVKVLSDPQTEILDKGGHILFAKEGDEIAGTVALLKVNDKLYEVGRMAVNERFQGKKIGQQLLAACIDKAREIGAEKLYLVSNTKLLTALSIYRKFGFAEVPLPQNSVYKRANIKMELAL